MAEENLNAAIAHAILSLVVSPCIGNSSLRGYISPGVHANLFSHGILGFLNFQGTKFGDFNKIYKISLVASKVLPLAFINADLKRSNDALSAVHLLSGLLPLGLTLTGSEDLKLVHLSCVLNNFALLYYSIESDRTWGIYAAGAAALSYFFAPNVEGVGPKVMYPLCLALFDYCTYRMGRSVTIGGPDAPRI